MTGPAYRPDQLLAARHDTPDQTGAVTEVEVLADDREPYMTVERMEQIMTPQMAAHVLSRTSMFRLAVGRDDYTDHLDKILAEDGHHLAFVYAVHAVARRA